jgi:hypothetical protein
MRPIEEIGPLIRQAEAAVERAQRPHLLHAGEMLLEARSQFTHDAEFKNWVRRNFPGQIRLAHRCLQLAAAHNDQTAREIEAARDAGYTA